MGQGKTVKKAAFSAVMFLMALTGDVSGVGSASVQSAVRPAAIEFVMKGGK